MICAICGTAIARGAPLVAAADLHGLGPGAGAPGRVQVPVAHLLCWYVRQLYAPAPLAPEASEADLRLDTWDGDCALCAEPVDAAGGAIRFAACSPTCARTYHLACAALASNLRRRLTCDACGTSPDVLASVAQRAIAAWEGLPPDTFYQREAVTRVVGLPVGGTDSILAMVEARATVGELVAAATGGPSVAKRLCQDLARLPADKRDRARPRGYYASPLVCLHHHGYTSTEMARLGLRFEMLFRAEADWALVLDRAVFPAEDLGRSDVGVNFTRLLLAGVPLDAFVGAGYTHTDLRRLRFHVRGFRAAGGTPEQLLALLGARDLSGVPAPETFGLGGTGGKMI